MTQKNGDSDGGDGGEKHEHFKLLQDVAEGLDKHSTVGYENAVRCMKILAGHPGNPQCVAFWKGHVYRMVQILLEQRPHALGVLEKSCVEDTSTITVKLMPKYPIRMDLILRIFDTHNIYYTGSRSNYQNFLGLPELRLNLLKIFAETGGFERIRESFCPDSAPWPPTQDMLVIIGGLKDAGAAVPREVCADMEKYAVRHLISMSEEQLKKESTDHLSHLITQLIQPKNSAMSDDSRYQFWLQHTLKMMNCSSIVLKLYAWDQVNDIVREALNSKPHPEEYVVRAAGTPAVNGTYTALFGADETPKYVKRAGDPPGAPELTLFRCTMRSKMKWWFISEADPEKPGTDRDIDYYQHKSVGEQQEREPPLSGWTLSMGAGSPGVYPPPILEPRGHYIPDETMQIDSFLISKIPKWIEDGGVLEVVFGTTMHRELILRSRKLFSFLADVNALTEAHISLMWKASMQSHDTEISDEIQSLLGALSLHLVPTLYTCLMDLLSNALKSDEGGKEGREQRFSKVAAFVEKFHHEFSRCLYQLPTDNGIQFLSLIWSLYRHPLAETCKAQPVFEEMLSSCLHERWNGGNVSAYIMECTEQLQSFSTLPDRQVNETHVSRILQSLVFMLSHESMRGSDAGLSVTGVPDILHGELLRFVKAQRAQCLERRGGDAAWYKAQLAKRLHLVRVFYGLSAVVSMTRQQIEEIWELLSHATEKEEMFVFLREAGVRSTVAESAFGLADCIFVFKSMICSPDVNWADSTEGMYDSFVTYSDGMKKVHTDEELPKISMETLWRITLSTPLDIVANKAISHLLRFYDSFDVSSNNTFLERVFSHLSQFDEKTNTSLDAASAVDVRLASRCVAVLNRAITDRTGAVQAPHITRGCMNRIRVVVTCRVQPAYYDSRTQKKATEQVFTLDMHPMNSLYTLKTRVCALVDGSKPDRVYLNFGSHYVSSPDTTQLAALGIVDGSEVVASLNLNNYGTSVPYGDDDADFKRDDGYHVGNLISRHALYFDILFSLLDKFTASSSSDETSEIGKAIWKIMMEIPTQPSMLKNVMECSTGLPPSSSEAWTELLRTTVNTGSASMTYRLQIVDALVQPAVEIPGEQVSCSAFVESGGFSAVLGFFLSTPQSEPRTEFRKLSDTIALHIIHYCLFGEDISEAPVALIAEVNASASDMVRTLLSAANFAAEGGQNGSVQDALVTLTYLLKSPDIAEQLTSNPQAKSLLTSVLRHDSKKVRDMAADFAVQVGKSQLVVFDWLLDEVDAMSTTELSCDELFVAFRILLIEQMTTLVGGPGLKKLATMLSNKLLAYPHAEAAHGYPAMLLGCLSLLKSLIEIDITALDGTVLGKNFVNTVLSEFLFAMPTPETDNSSLCVRPISRKITFEALVTFLNQRPQDYPLVFEQLHKLMELSSVQLRHSWGVSNFHDHRRLAKVGFTGLKNQGCTCYSNSLLQQLFMNLPFRKAVMSTPLRSSHRSSLWHMKDDDIVGKEILLEWDGGSWRRAHVTNFDHAAGVHVIRYRDLNGQLGEELHFNIRGGASRIKKETGRVKLLTEPLPGADGNGPSESEASAYRILEQLQRTFCFLEHSKQAYIDPKPLIEACRPLNLNYDVYHQNDASEFCDQLLDRLETAMRGKHTGVDVWKENVLTNIFGGGMLYQKIPEECEFYESDRLECGHWQSTREEAFLKCELIIRGKENIEESLEQLVEGELMNGDNKIMCEKCNQKKDTVRRTCFDVLPNTLIIHLKRFDLDFQTFETVKLNNKIAFPNRLSMYKYTKEGMEAEEQAKILVEEGGTILSNPDISRDMSDPGAPPSGSRSNSMAGENAGAPILSTQDLSDYEYELQGVLVHAGIAAGGHYYSFIRDIYDTAEGGDSTEKWYRFNDEDVSSFNPENIPSSCFGGTYSTTTGMHDAIEEDRSANALMLFFRKVKPTTRQSVVEEQTSGSAGGAGVVVPSGPTPEELALRNELDPLINGYQAFEREVWETNMKHLVAEYVLDTDLHNFVRNILSTMCRGSDSLEDEANALSLAAIPAEIKMNEVASFGCHFFVDVVLHCKDRSGVKLWLDVLLAYFKKFPSTADWFLVHILTRTQCSWIRDYLLHSTDALASASFVQLVVGAGLAVVQHAESRAPDTVMTATSRVLEVVDMVLDMLPLVPLNWRTADELFIALRDLSAIPCVAEYLVKKDVVAKLAYFAIPEQVPAHIRAVYETASTVAKDFSSLLQTVFEVIAALLGIPQIRRAPLIEEDPKTLLSQLTRPAITALTTIFKENCTGGKMDFRDVLSYMEKTCQNQKQANMQARNVLDRFGDRTSTSLSLDGFLLCYLKTAVYNPKGVWKDIHFFGFQNDLTRPSFHRNAQTDADAVSSTYSASSDSLMSIVPMASRDCLLRLGLYEAAMYDAEAAAVSVAKRVCYGDISASTSILKQSLSRLNRTIVEFWSTDTELILNFIRAMVSLNDGLLSERMHEIVFGDDGYLTKYYFESQRALSGAGRHAGYPHEGKMWAEQYLKQFSALCSQSPATMAWVQEFVLRDPAHAWLAPSVQPSKVMDLDETVSNKIILVSDAGVSEVDGQYLFVKMHNGAGMFEKDPTMYNGRIVSFTIYRCPLQNKKHSWYISYTSDGNLPGTTSDVDFYSAPALYQEGRPETNDPLPPTSNWTVISVGGLEPVPNIDILEGDGVDIDSDRSMVVIDDESSSQPDTDIPPLNSYVDNIDIDGYPSYNAI